MKSEGTTRLGLSQGTPVRYRSLFRINKEKCEMKKEMGFIKNEVITPSNVENTCTIYVHCTERCPVPVLSINSGRVVHVL